MNASAHRESERRLKQKLNGFSYVKRLSLIYSASALWNYLLEQIYRPLLID